MVKVYPFKAFVPSKKLADRVVTLGSGKVPEAALREKAENNEANKRILTILKTLLKTSKIRIINGHKSPSKLISVD